LDSSYPINLMILSVAIVNKNAGLESIVRRPQYVINFDFNNRPTNS